MLTLLIYLCLQLAFFWHSRDFLHFWLSNASVKGQKLHSRQITIQKTACQHHIHHILEDRKWTKIIRNRHFRDPLKEDLENSKPQHIEKEIRNIVNERLHHLSKSPSQIFFKLLSNLPVIIY